MGSHEWHGYRFPDLDRAVHVGPLPRRKKVALYTLGKGGFKVLAYFRSEEDAADFLAFLDTLVDGKAGNDG